MTRSAPARAFWHDDRRIPNAGGVAADSPAGMRDAVRHRRRWIDQDGQLMHHRHAGVRLGRRDRDVVWVCAHGEPFMPDYIPAGTRFEDHAYEAIDAAEHGLQTAREVFTAAAAARRKVEWEVKDLRPFTSRRALRNALRLLAIDAEAAFGSGWQQHVEVKVLNNLRGGNGYALKVLRAAKRAGFTTMLLNHRGRPVVIGPVRARYVDQVRGPWRGRLRRKVRR